MKKEENNIMTAETKSPTQGDSHSADGIYTAAGGIAERCPSNSREI